MLFPLQVSELEEKIEKMTEETRASTARAQELAQLQDKSIVSGDLIKRVSDSVLIFKLSYLLVGK